MTLRLRFWPFILAATLLSCGPAQRQQVLVRFLDEAPSRIGTDWCAGRAIEQEASANTRVYLPQQFIVHRWRGEPPDSTAPIPETEVLAALDESRLGLTLLAAMPGQGKTRFAEAIEARLCGTMPILRLDVANDFLKRTDRNENDAVPDQLARQLRLTSREKQAEFRDLLDAARWVLVVDSLHEVPETKRPAVLQALRKFVEAHRRRLQIVVLARTELLAVPDALLPFDTVLEIPPLDCGRAETYVATLTRDKAPRFWAVVARYGLDAKVMQEGATGPTAKCSFRHLTSYRSVRVAVDAARGFGLDSTAVSEGPRVLAVAKFGTGILAHDLEPLRVTPAQGLALVEAMVAPLSTAVLASDVPFTPEACHAAAKGKVGDVAETCRRLLDSPLFVRAAGHWRLSGPPFDGWVRALALAKRIDTGGCATLPSSGLVLATPDTAGLLAGLPQGGKCLAELALALCSGPAGVDGAVRELSAGLAQGAARVQALQGVKAEGCGAVVVARLGK